MYMEQITQALGFATEVDPQVINNTNKTTGSIDMSQFHRALFIINVGAVTVGGSLNFQLVEDVNANLSTATNLAGNNASQTGFTTANKLVTFEARADQMSKRYLRLAVTENVGQNVYVCVIAFGAVAVHQPNTPQNGSAISTQNVVA